MLDHLCQTNSYSTIYQDDFQSFQYGDQLKLFSGNSLDANTKIALLSTDEGSYQDVRKALLQLRANFKYDELVDLGCIKGGSIGLTETVDLLLSQKIFPIIIGKEKKMIEAQVRAYEHHLEALQLSLVDSHLDWSSESSTFLINRLLSNAPKSVAELSCLGYQAHYCNPTTMDFLHDRFFELHRLNTLQQNLAEAEPAARHSDAFAFNLSAVRASDAPCTILANPNGFFAVEACRLVRYAAMSDCSKSLSIVGYDDQLQDHGQTAMLVAQLIWYAVSGFYARKHDYPIDYNRLKKYAVDSANYREPLTFYKSPKSERWWLWLPELSKHPLYEDVPLLPCSYQDYQKACVGELSDRLLKAFELALGFLKD